MPWGRRVATMLIVAAAGLLALRGCAIYDFVRLERLEEPFVGPMGPFSAWRLSTGRRSYLADRWTGTEHGISTTFHQNSSVIARQGRMHDGEEVGVWTEWDRSGRVTRQRHPHESGFGRVHRESPPWLENPQNQQVPADLIWQPDGELLGYWFDTAILSVRENWRKGQLHGVSTFWDSRGRLIRQERFVAGERVETRYEAPWREGQEDQVLDGDVLINGPAWHWRDWDALEATVDVLTLEPLDLTRVHYRNGQRHGEFFGWNDRRLVYSGEFWNDRPVGVHTIWRLQPTRAIYWQGRYSDGLLGDVRSTPPFWQPVVGPALPLRPSVVSAGVRAIEPPRFRSPDGRLVWEYVRGNFALGEFCDGLKSGEWEYHDSTLRALAPSSPTVVRFEKGVLQQPQ